MKIYEYMVLKETDTTTYSLDDINALGAKGWRVIHVYDNGHEHTLLEKEHVQEDHNMNENEGANTGI